jgi:hypothetical protein
MDTGVLTMTSNKVLTWPKLFEGRVYSGFYAMYRTIEDGTGDGPRCDDYGDGVGDGHWGRDGGSIGHIYRRRNYGGKRL